MKERSGSEDDRVTCSSGRDPSFLSDLTWMSCENSKNSKFLPQVNAFLFNKMVS